MIYTVFYCQLPVHQYNAIISNWQIIINLSVYFGKPIKGPLNINASDGGGGGRFLELIVVVDLLPFVNIAVEATTGFRVSWFYDRLLGQGV